MTQKRLLIVEDDPNTMLTLQVALERAGYIIECTGNGREALEKIQRQIPDLILLDIMMPEMDGFTLNKHLKQDPKTKDIPVFVLTARSQMVKLFGPEDETKAEEYMVKPIPLKVLLEKLEKFFGKK